MTVSIEVLDSIGNRLYSSEFNGILTTYYSFDEKVYSATKDLYTDDVTVEEVVR